MEPSPNDPIEAVVDRIVERGGTSVHIAAPLGLGKPNRLLNALYARFKNDPTKKLVLTTALSLNPPKGKSELEKRFFGPFAQRHFGVSYPRLAYEDDVASNSLPPNVTIQELYFASGATLGSERAQRDYVSINYTMVARELVAGGDLHAVVQLVAKRGESYSLSCNPDVTLDLLDRLAAAGKPKPLIVGVVHPDLPFLGGDAEVSADLFDVILDSSSEEQPLFALPREPVDMSEHAIGLHASTLVKDGGTLQIGIGAISDALVAALVMRHEKNDAYRSALAALGRGDAANEALITKIGGSAPFEQGLYGVSEMVTDGFMHLRKAGILKRVVHDETSSPTSSAGATKNGHYLKGASVLGSKELYAWLRELEGEDYTGLFMGRVSDVNQLYGGREELGARQRKDARFFNVCMMATALGAAVSDSLEDGRVVSGVGGQYDVVAMAHALEGGRSTLMLRSTFTTGDKTVSNVRFSFSHLTIPRHLRDIFVTEYGVADLRGKSDEECTKAMLAVTDARFQDEIVRAAIRGKKLAKGFTVPDAWKQNTPAALEAKMKPLAAQGLLPKFPFGSDFTPVEERLRVALGWLQTNVKSEEWGALAGAMAWPRRTAESDACVERLGLAAPATFKERMLARLVRGALARTT